MKAYILVLFFIAAVFGCASSSQSNWTIVASELGRTVELVDESEEPEDLAIEDSELKSKVLFNLYTSSNTDTAEVIYVDDDDTLAASNFDSSKPTRFVIHGWQSSGTSNVCINTRDAYLAQGDYNVIAVDWSAYAGLGYVYARTTLVRVGEYIGQMIDYLENQGMDISELIVIGHSLGAHIAGLSGRSATNTVGTVVGLDPAGPLFYFTDTKARMRSTDADFVHVIHTNTAILGYNGELGDVDFWPNGGQWQAGCDWDVFGTCSHSRSYYFFVESIDDDATQFVSHSCSSYSNYAASLCTDNESTYMGGSDLDKTASGSFYLTTNSDSPYALG